MEEEDTNLVVPVPPPPPEEASARRETDHTLSNRTTCQVVEFLKTEVQTHAY
jgi:hypothetical protein